VRSSEVIWEMVYIATDVDIVINKPGSVQQFRLAITPKTWCNESSFDMAIPRSDARGFGL
jgi:hypothetical protein